MLCALCIVHCALCIVHCAVCSVQCALCTVQCALCMCTVQCALCDSSSSVGKEPGCSTNKYVWPRNFSWRSDPGVFLLNLYSSRNPCRPSLSLSHREKYNCKFAVPVPQRARAGVATPILVCIQQIKDCSWLLTLGTGAGYILTLFSIEEEMIVATDSRNRGRLHSCFVFNRGRDVPDHWLWEQGPTTYSHCIQQRKRCSWPMTLGTGADYILALYSTEEGMFLTTDSRNRGRLHFRFVFNRVRDVPDHWL
jgi:hypothetical protein